MSRFVRACRGWLWSAMFRGRQQACFSSMLARLLFVLITLAGSTGAHALAVTSGANGNWSAVGTWAIVTAGIPGTITSVTTSPTVNGTSTAFNQLVAGDQLYTTANVLIGTIQTVVSAAQVTLTANAGANVTNGTYRIRKRPNQFDTVTIANTVQLETSPTVISMTVSGTLTFNGAAAARTLTVNGNVTVTGTVNVSANNQIHTMNVSGDIANNGAGVFDLVNTAARAANLVLTSGATQTISGTSTGVTEFLALSTTGAGNVTINKTAGAAVTQTGTLTVGGILTVQAGTYNLASTVGVTGATTVSGTLGIVTSAAVVRTFTGTVTVNALASWNNAINAPITFGANFSNSGTFTSGSGTQTFNAAGGGQLLGSAAMTFSGILTATNGLTVNKTGAVVTLNAASTVGAVGLTVTAGTLSLANGLTVTGPTNLSGTLTISNATGTRTFTGAVTVNGGGNWNNSGNAAVGFGSSFSNSGTFTSGSNTQTFSAAGGGQLLGSAAMTFSGVLAATNGLTVNKTGAVVTLNAASTVGATGLTVTAGTLTVANGLSVTGPTIVSGAIDISSITGTRTFTGAVTVTGSWSNTGNAPVTFGNNLTYSGTAFSSGSAQQSFTNAAATIAGTAAMTFSGPVVATSNLSINKSVGIAVTTNAALTVPGILTVTQGTLTIANAATVTGATNVAGALDHSTATGARTFTGAVTVTGSWTNTGNSPVTFGNNLTYSGTTFSSGTAQQSFTVATPVLGGTAAMTFSGPVVATTNLTINKSAGIGVTTNAALTVPGALTVTQGNLIVANAITVTGATTVTSSLDHSTATGARTFTGAVTVNGSWTSTGNAPVTFGNNLTYSGTTFSSGTGQQSFTNAAATILGTAAMTFAGPVTATTTLTINKSLGIVVTMNGTTTIPTNLTVTQGVLANGGAMTVSGNATVSTNGVLRSDAGTMVVNGAAGVAVNAGRMQIDAGAVTVGDAVNESIILSNAATSRLIVNGGTLSVAGRIANASLTGLGNVTFTAGTVTVGTIGNNVNNALNAPFLIGSGMTFVWSGGTLVIQSANAQATAREYDVRSTVVNSTITGGTLQLANGSSAAAQVFQITSVPPVWNLTTNGANSPNATLIAALTVNGNVTLGAGSTLSAASLAIAVKGNWTNNGATYTPGTQAVTFSGTSAQTIDGSSATTFNSVTINNSTGVSLSGVNASLNATGVLTLTSGVVTTGSQQLIVLNTGAAAAVSGGSTTAHVQGNLTRALATAAANYAFPVGAGGTYTPVTLNFGTITTPGNVTVSSTSGEHPQIGASALDGNASVNRYWTLAVTTLVASNGTATYTFLPADIDGGGSPSTFQTGTYTSSTWTYPTTGTITTGVTDTFQATGLTSTTLPGDVVLAGFGNPLSWWRMDEGSWNGSASEVIDYGTGGYAGTANGLTTKPTTSSASPAIGGTPGTCQYGAFNRTNKHYVDVSGIPNLANTGSTGFTATAWINASSVALAGQRVILDDANNVTGSWGLTLGDAGSGLLGFYYRQGTAFNLNTGVAISAGTWYFVAVAVRLQSSGLSAATIYVYNTAGTLVTSATNTFTWTPGADAGPLTIGGESNSASASENTSSFGFGGSIDEVRLYKSALNQTQVNNVRQLTHTCILVEHYAISYPGGVTGVTCEASDVLISAHDSSHNPTSPANGTTLTVTTSTGTGVWQSGTVSGTGTWTPSGANNGAATYVWPGTENTVRVRLRQNAAVTMGINLSDSNGKIEHVTEDTSITFADSAFRVTTNGTGTATIGTQIAGKNSNAGFGGQTLYVQAIRTDSNTGSCSGIFPGQNVTIEMAGAFMNPTTGSSQLTVLDRNGAMVGLNMGGGSAGAYGGVSLSFDAQSKAPLVVNYPDAGGVAIYARYQLPTPPSGTYVSGSSNTFIVRPFGFRVSGPTTAATPASGSAVFRKAGENFDVAVTAVAWKSGDDADVDGIPDSDTQIATNPATPNFGLETPAQTATLSHTLNAPIGGNSGALGGSTAYSSFSAGTRTQTVNWSEVGFIDLIATNSDYLATGQSVRNSTTGLTGVGRFYPDHFYIPAGSSITHRSGAACAPASSFTYMDESFTASFSLQARNTAGTITQNYTTAGSYAKLNPAVIAQLGLGAKSGATNMTSRVNVGGGSTGSFVNGEASVVATLAINRSTSPDGPHTALKLGAAPVESGGDGVTLRLADMDIDVDSSGANDHRQVGADANIRFGRMIIGNALGSELLDLPMQLRVQYWSTSGYVTNTDDTCTTIAATDIALGSYKRNLAACETTVSFPSGQFVSGVRTFRLTKPGANNQGSVDLTVNLGLTATGNSCAPATAAATTANRPYLRGQWSGSVNYDQNPGGRASFGIYRGNDDFVFVREN